MRSILQTAKKNRPYVPIDKKEMEIYIHNELSKIKFDYEQDKIVDQKKLKEDLILASEKMQLRCKKISLIPDMDVEIIINSQKITICKVNNSKGALTCELDQRLLRRILDRSSHWNNAEIGCHIEFVRTPNYYSPDIHTMLQFLHL